MGSSGFSRILHRQPSSVQIVMWVSSVWGGELLHVYPSAVAAAKATYGLVYGIRGCCRGEHITSGGFRWHYVHKDTHAIIYPINK